MKNRFVWFFLTGLVTALLAYRLVRNRKSPKILLIVGNGFDLYHGIPSSYTDFRRYLQLHHPDVHEAMEEYLGLRDDSEWNGFEARLAILDGDALLDENLMFLGDGEKASDWGDFQYEVGKTTELLGEKMQFYFLEWILQLPIKHASGTPRLTLPKDGVFLNFNYTDSLQQFYRIDPARILYIHGEATDSSSEIVLGHAWANHNNVFDEGPLSYEDFKDGNYSTEPDWRVDEGRELIKGYFQRNFKNGSAIIKSNRHFFRRLKKVEEIYVMGHSMEVVDAIYFAEIVRNINARKVKWMVSYYKAEDVASCTNTLTKAGVNLNLVTFRKLSDLFSNQIPLF